MLGVSGPVVQKAPLMPADPNDFGDMLSMSDVAQLLDVHINTAQRYAREGIIPAHRLAGSKRYYVLKDELLEHIRRQPVDYREAHTSSGSQEG